MWVKINTNHHHHHRRSACAPVPRCVLRPHRSIRKRASEFWPSSEPNSPAVTFFPAIPEPGGVSTMLLYNSYWNGATRAERRTCGQAGHPGFEGLERNQQICRQPTRIRLPSRISEVLAAERVFNRREATTLSIPGKQLLERLVVLQTTPGWVSALLLERLWWQVHRPRHGRPCPGGSVR